jgi:hypothetical protein
VKALLWTLRHHAGRIGPIGCGACVLLAASAALHWGVTVPGLAHLHAAQARAASERAHATQTRHDGGERARLAASLAVFPQSGSGAVNAVLGTIQAQAEAHHLAFDNASCQLSPDGSGTFERYTVSLPLKGRYPDMRAFLAQASASIPHLALDSVSLARPAREDALVEAQFQFTAYFRVRP